VGVALGIKIPRELVVRGPGNDALLVEQGQHAGVLPADEVKYILVVRERNEFPQDALSFVLILLELEHVLVELLLE